MSDQRKELGQRATAELEALFGNMYSGWDRGVVVSQERFGTGETKFTERPMTELELAARYVAAEIGVNIYEIAGRAAFAPIITFSQIQVHVGPVFERLATERDELRNQLGKKDKALKVALRQWRFYADMEAGEGDGRDLAREETLEGAEYRGCRTTLIDETR